MLAIVLHGLAAVLWTVATLAAVSAGYPLWAAFNFAMVFFSIFLMALSERGYNKQKALSDS